MKDKLPPGVTHAFWFQAFNAISFQICLGAPLILFARKLGASATTLGLLAGMPAILGIVQLPAARYVEDIGYRRMMVGGWTARVFFLVLLTILPLLTWYIPPEAVINLLLTTIFLFALLRGISACAWLPWFAKLVPDAIRGEYLAHERNYICIASTITIFSCGLILNTPSMPAFSLIFFISFLGGAISLPFLRRIPDAPTDRSQTKNPSSISWLQIVKDTTFMKLLAFAVFTQIAVSANGTFVILFLRENGGLTDRTILWLTSGSALMGILALNQMGKHADKAGSKPCFGLVLFWWQIYFLLWLLISSHDGYHLKWLAMILMIASGFFGPIFELSQTRLLMNTVGTKEGATQYYAFWAVATSLVVAVVPIIWGIILDVTRTWEMRILDFNLNRFSLFFGVEWLLIFPLAFLLTRVKETKSESTTSMIYELFIAYPIRSLSNVFSQFK